MSEHDDEIDGQLKALFDQARLVPPLDPQVAAKQRANFLDQVEAYRAMLPKTAGCETENWLDTLFRSMRGKSHGLVLNTILAMVLSFFLLFGGVGATAYASQGSLPGEALYSVKTWSEDIQLSMAASYQRKLSLEMGFSDRRVSEIASLQVNGKLVPERVANRLQVELDKMLQFAAGMDDTSMRQALTQIRQQAERQSEWITMMMGVGPGRSDQNLRRIQMRLQAQIKLASQGMMDPQGFRQQIHAPSATHEGASEETP